MNYIVALMQVVGLLVAVAVSGCSPRENPKDAKAIAEIVRLGGTVSVDETRPDKPVISATLGPDASGSTNVTDAGLEPIRGLTQLQKLDVACTQVTDSGLDNLIGLN